MLVGDDVFYSGLLTPKILEPGFRPVGDLYYRYLGRAFKLNYPPFVAVLQAFHVLNVVLVFVLLLRMGFPDFTAASATLFYVFHAALVDAYWQPQYFFEVLTSILCLTTVLLYLCGHWIVGLIPFWLAYRARWPSAALAEQCRREI